MSDQTALVVSPRHPWATRKSPVQLSELAGQVVALSKRRSGTWRIVEALLSNTGLQIGSILEMGASEGGKRAIAADMGVALLSRHVLGHELTNGILETVPLAGGELDRDLYLVCHKDRYLSRAAQAFVELLQ